MAQTSTNIYRIKDTGNAEHPVNDGVINVIGTQTAATAAWTGNIPINALYTGLTINYYLPYDGISSTNVTLNLTLADGTTTTGAKNVYTTAAGRLTTHYNAGRNILMTYYAAGDISIKGTATTDDRWICDAYSDSNDLAYQIRNYYNYYKAGANKIFPYTFIMQCSDGRWESIVTSSSTGTSKTRNTHGFRLGQLALMYANATYNENAKIADANVWFQQSSDLVDHRYSFNTANNATSGTTSQKPIYLVGSINSSDGLFYLDATWWTQTLPSTADGKLYIYLGDAFDYYRMTFVVKNPIYQYIDGKIQEYSQSTSYASSAGTVNGHTVAKDVPSDAKFTDTNNKVDQELYSDDYDLPLLMSYVSINNQDTTINNKAFRNNSIYANPSTGNIQATKLNGTTIGNSPSFSDDKVNQILDSTNSNRPIALCYGSTSNTDTNSVHQLYRNNNIYANPSTGYLYAKSFYDSYYSVWASEAVKLTENTDNNLFPIVFGTNATTDTKVGGLYKNYASHFRYNPTHHNMFSHNICGLTFSGGITTTGNDCKVVSMALKFRASAGYSGLIFSRGGLAAFFLKMPSTYSTSGATFSSNILVGNMTIQCSGGTDEAMGNSYFVSVTSNTGNDYIRFIWASNSQGSTRYDETYYRAYANGSSTNTIDSSKRWV